MPAHYDVHTLSDLYTQSSSLRPRLRVGLLLDGPVLCAAFASIVEDLLRANFVDLVVAVYNQEENNTQPVTGPAPVRLAKILANSARRRQLGFALYHRLDQKLHSADIDPNVDNDPNEDVDCSAQLAAIPRLDVVPIRKNFVHRFPEEALEQLRAYQPDVLLRFGFNILRGGILQLPTYGIWSFHHGDNDFYRGGPACFWELYEGNPLSGVMLQILTEKLDDGKVLAKALFSSEPDSFSLLRNRYQPFWGSAHFVLRFLWQVHAYGWDQVRERILPTEPYQGQRKLYVTPTNSEIASWTASKLAGRVHARLQRLFRGESIRHWQMALRLDPNADILQQPEAPLDGFRLIESPRGHFYADPFLIEQDDTAWLFFEDLDYSQGRGVIAAARIGADGTVAPAETVLDTGSHSSYPLVFQHQGEHFMVPETMAERSVWLYRAHRFPFEWKREALLFRGPAADTTPFFHQDRWWFFTTLIDPRSEAGGLFLFSSAELTGQWEPHPMNPISFDVRTSRCAGQVISHNGELYRSSQNGAGLYGRSLALHRITELSPSRYSEQCVRQVLPTTFPGQLGIHTYNRLSTSRHHIEVVDALIMRRAPDVR